MHAGVFRAGISEEAFKKLLDVMESNFAALTLPAEINAEDNRVANNNNSKKIAVITRSKTITEASFSPGLYREGINLRVSRIIQNPRSREISGVLEIVFPIFLNPRPDKSTMKQVKSSEDNHTHEPMEIEEIILPERSAEVTEPFFSEDKPEGDAKFSGDSRGKNILRESKLAKIFEAPETPKSEPAEKDVSEKSNGSDIQKMKSRLRPLVKKETKEQRDTERSCFFYFWQMLFFILFPIAIVVACVSVARDEIDADNCTPSFNATAAIRDLENRVFGQSEAIRDLGYHFSSNSGRFTALALIGGTGVGKSYAAHIIGENFSPKKNVFQYVPPLESRRRYAAGVASRCGCNLIILENLGNKDILEAANFVEYLAGTVAENYCVFVLEVINVQETDNNLKRDVNLAKSTEDIERVYREKELGIKIVQFQPLDDDVLNRCITDAAKSRNLTLSQKDIDDVRFSLKNSDTGCKGARAKVQLLDSN